MSTLRLVPAEHGDLPHIKREPGSHLPGKDSAIEKYLSQRAEQQESKLVNIQQVWRDTGIQLIFEVINVTLSSEEPDCVLSTQVGGAGWHVQGQVPAERLVG